jgi:hypothetical protein
MKNPWKCPKYARSHPGLTQISSNFQIKKAQIPVKSRLSAKNINAEDGT